ncbi:hypothetical protein DSL72_002791 [Monilinia vaccinii-corymbosi]|uniref:Uncharacterized protein n=1 Tax=Monilinia vaccinii-corymbosi TaxID=61207 RepID=A0A8A3PDP4_9HELO|nr:hypothetical protein DSL72_002791 [Monilinia vaccinii-corymbosi]
MRSTILTTVFCLAAFTQGMVIPQQPNADIPTPAVVERGDSIQQPNGDVLMRTVDTGSEVERDAIIDARLNLDRDTTMDTESEADSDSILDLGLGIN